RTLHSFPTRRSSDLTAADLSFRWGPLEALAFLPRVEIGRVIVAPARWRLFADALRGLVSPGVARFRAVQRLREELGIPRRVEIGDRKSTRLNSSHLV